ncbi:RPA-related protein RADX-like [Ptychodera flava]|uniref:RPA-related protein RADX-like n=1 Tax=Ptychodera flava TaxID=63121 RepID=UPI00396AAADB
MAVGTVLLLENYDIKKRYSQHTRPVLHNPELKFLEAELSLNSSHPEAVIQLIRPTTIPNDFRLPNVNHQFLTRRQLRGTPDQLICDVCGIVTFVGRWQRTRNTKKATCAQPGKALSASGLYSDESSTSVRKNSRSLQCLFLTTTNETQLHIDNHSASTYKNEIIISMLQSWRNSVVFKEALETSAVGGYYSYPALPTRFEDYEKQFSPDNVLKIVPIHSLQAELDGLHYREHKTFIVQGHITSVGIVKLHSRKEVSTTETELSTSESSMSESEEDIFSPIQTRMTRKRKLQDELSENAPHRVLRNRTVEITTIRDLEQHLNKMNRKRSKTSKEKQKLRQDETVSTEAAVDVPTDTDYRSVEIQEVYNIDEQWAFLKQNITVIGEHSICKETLPRRYSEDHARALEYMFGLQPSRIADDFRSVREKIEDIPIAQSVQEYYEITLLGLNRTSAVKTFFLPVRAEGDHRPASQNSQYSILSVLATGILPPDKEDPTPEGKSTTRQTRRAGKAAKKSAWSSREGNYQGDVMANVKTVRDRRVIAVLEVYRCGNGEVEIILNRAYAAD